MSAYVCKPYNYGANEIFNSKARATKPIIRAALIGEEFVFNETHTELEDIGFAYGSSWVGSLTLSKYSDLEVYIGRLPHMFNCVFKIPYAMVFYIELDSKYSECERQIPISAFFATEGGSLGGSVLKCEGDGLYVTNGSEYDKNNFIVLSGRTPEQAVYYSLTKRQNSMMKYYNNITTSSMHSYKDYDVEYHHNTKQKYLIDMERYDNDE